MSCDTDTTGRAGNRPHLLITGVPGVGKTTVIRALATRLAHHHPAGFFTEEIRNAHGARIGFQLRSFCGRQLVLAHVNFHGRHRVGRYGVDVEGFERLLTELDLTHSPSRLIVIDEIGKMECCSRRFIEEVTALLDGPTNLIATIALKGEGFIRGVKDRPDCRLVTVTRENRDRLVSDLVIQAEQGQKAATD
jgi:nucleoside-triphosphatase